MNKIFIVGYFGFDNFGDELLLSNFIKLITKFCCLDNKEKKFFILHNTKDFRVKDNFVYIPRWSLYYMLWAISKIDVVVFLGGVFQDQTSVRSLFYYIFIILLSKIFKKTVIILSTEISIKKIPKILEKIIFNLIDFAVLRNKIDVQKIALNSHRIRFCPDIGYYSKNESFKKSENFKKQIRNIALILKYDIKEFKKIINFCRYLEQKYDLIFIPFHLREDYRFSLRISRILRKCIIRVWDKIENYFGLFEGVDLVISSRLHGIVISGLLKIPFICVSNQDKINKIVFSDSKVLCKDYLELINTDIEKFVLFPHENFYSQCIEKTFIETSKFFGGI
ncbi:MAG: polysaccharide pyruvyl transferase family protein [Endomicrobia bacterium]|nr:polysaccharide pyruvyl transferase family protein [Endomicrobiia bacterium]